MERLSAMFPKESKGRNGVKGTAGQPCIASANAQAGVPPVHSDASRRRNDHFGVSHRRASPMQAHARGEGVRAEVGLVEAAIGQMSQGGADREVEGAGDPNSPGHSDLQAEVPWAGQRERARAIGAVGATGPGRAEAEFQETEVANWEPGKPEG